MSDWTASEAKEFLAIIRSEAEKAAKNYANKQSSVFACLAIVTDIAESGAITVRLLSSPSDGSQDFVVRNRSGSTLEVGDSVWLHYWSDYTNVYIAVRNMGDTEADITATGIGALSYTEAQSLSAAQKTQVLANAGAAPSTHASQHLIGGSDPLNALPHNAVSSNLLINGGMLIWQRGTSFTATGYTADRWKLTLGTGMAITLTQQSFTAGQTDVPGEPTYYAQIAISNAGSGDGAFEQRIEDVRTAAGSPISYSFYAKCSTTTYAAQVVAVQNFGSGGSSDVLTTAQNITLSTTWQKFTGTFTLGGISGKTIGSGNYLALRLVLPTASGTKTLSLSNFQINYGPVALPYVSRPLPDELRLCKRYYQILNVIWSTYVYNLTQIDFRTSIFPVEMRVAPAITIYNGTNLGGQANYIDNYGVGPVSLSGATISSTPTWMTTIIKTNAFSSTGKYSGSATLDAEL